MKETFQERLNQALRIRNMKAVDLAKKTGLSKPRISQYVNGISEARQEALFKISTVLNVNEAWLMGYDVPMERSIISNFPLSDHEQKVVAAYRAKPEMQSAVDTLLGVKEEEIIHPKTHEKLHKVQIAARNGKFEEKYMTDKEIQEIMNLPDIPDDDLL